MVCCTEANEEYDPAISKSLQDFFICRLLFSSCHSSSLLILKNFSVAGVDKGLQFLHDDSASPGHRSIKYDSFMTVLKILILMLIFRLLDPQTFFSC